MSPPTHDRPLRIALLASECAPFAKTGGLADVVAALGRALHALGHDVRIFLPCYRNLREVEADLSPDDVVRDRSLSLGGRELGFSVLRGELPRTSDATGAGGLDVEFIDCPALYHRSDYYTEDEDEAVRWGAFGCMALEAMQVTGWSPDVIHCNDWHTGLVPLYLKARYGWDQMFEGTRTLLSIHNIGYQGVFGADQIQALGLGDHRDKFHQEQLEDGQINLLVTGVLWSTYISTVSETYAREIQTEEFGMGLEGLLQRRADHLVGIVNGIDAVEWSPALDPKIPANFTRDDLRGKDRCRDALLSRFGLAPRPTGPVFGIVSRMTSQKGFDLLPDALPVLLQQNDVRLCVLGSGEKRYEQYFQWLRDSYPDKVGFYRGYNDELSHWIEAGSDVFLMPSRYEPCGLNQMYSQAYGTLPLVRHTGGLADTVERWDPETRRGTGFVFYEATPHAIVGTLEHVLDVWRDSEAWAMLRAQAMARDFSWESQAQRYVDLYRRI